MNSLSTQSTQLSGADANSVLDLIQMALLSNNHTQLEKLFEKLKFLVSFDHVRSTYGNREDGLLEGMSILNIFFSFPAAWEERYNRKGYFFKDSVAMTAFHYNGLFSWKDAQKKIVIDESKLVSSEASDFGLVDGWIYSQAGTSRSECSIISISGTNIETDNRSKIILDHVLPHLSQAIRRIHYLNKKEIVNLTSRELEVLRWIADGKSAWEISIILNISRSTVQFHTQNILRKTDSLNSQQAVAKTIRAEIMIQQD